MSLARLINRPCTIRHETEGDADEYGNAEAKVSEVETVCELQQQPAYRREDEGEVSDTRWVIYLLPDAVIGSGDSIDVADEGVFEVFGEPWKARNPRTGRISHIEVPVRRTSGSNEAAGGS